MAGKNKGGRPPLYSDPEEMQRVIDQYFEECEERLRVDAEGNLLFDRFGRPVTYRNKIPTIAGLTRALGFKERASLLYYQGKSKFRGIIQDAKLRVEIYAEEQLFTRDGCNGARFTLWNNFGWKQKPETESESIPVAVQIINDIPRTNVG